MGTALAAELAAAALATLLAAASGGDVPGPEPEPTRRYIGFISALSRHRRRHVHCAGMGVPVLKMTASPRERERESRYRAIYSRKETLAYGNAWMLGRAFGHVVGMLRACV